MAGASKLLRRAPHVVSYWDGGRLVFHNFATGVVVAGDPIASQVLHFFDRWRSADGLAGYLGVYSRPSVHRTIKALERATLLIRRDAAGDPITSGLTGWAREGWNPSAGFFHLSTKDVTYVDEDRFTSSWHAQHRRGKRPPDVVKRYPRAPVRHLPRAKLAGEYVDVLRGRRTWRRFARRSISATDLATLLHLTFGVQAWLEGADVPRLALKTAPSGGARHSVEAYVLVRRVDGIAAGIYHYAPDRHHLELLTRDTRPRRVSRYLPTQHWFGGAAALVLMTAVFPRVQWRYPFARAYRVVLAEAGHLCQNFCLTATWLGLAPFCSMALADSVIERDLRIDGVNESVLYACGVGKRPPGAAPPAWPEERPRRAKKRSTR